MFGRRKKSVAFSSLENKDDSGKIENKLSLLIESALQCKKKLPRGLTNKTESESEEN